MSDVLTSLDDIDANTWALFQRMASDGSLATLATTDITGGASARLLVVRAADPEERTLSFWTHAASQKVAEIEANPHGEVSVWCEDERLQIRAKVELSLNLGDSFAWAELGDGSRRNYAVPAPGTMLHDPNDFEPQPDAALFMVVIAKVKRLDILSLRQLPHRRAIIDSGGTRWVAP